MALGYRTVVPEHVSYFTMSEFLARNSEGLVCKINIIVIQSQGKMQAEFGLAGKRPGLRSATAPTSAPKAPQGLRSADMDRTGRASIRS